MRALVVSTVLTAAVGCGSAETGVEEPSAPPCSIETLETFDPGAAVLDRRIERVLRSGTLSRQERIVVTKCEKDEPEDECMSRGKQAAESAHPGASVTVEPEYQEHFAATYQVGKKTIEKAFDDVEALKKELERHEKRGKKVSLLSGQQERVEDGWVRAIATAIIDPGFDTKVLELRMHLTLQSGGAELMAELQRRAKSARLTISKFATEPDGTTAVRLSCTRQRRESDSSARTGAGARPKRS